jgi:hypothetical protein
MDFLQKVFYGVFELPLLRNAQKRHIFFLIKKKRYYLPHLPSARYTPLPILFFFGAPRPRATRHRRPDRPPLKLCLVFLLSFVFFFVAAGIAGRCFRV